MGQLVSKKQSGDARHCTPLGLYDTCAWDNKILKQLITTKRLAPIFKGHQDERPDFDECPICMLYYPYLNCSRCCKKYICTECYLQIRKPPGTEGEKESSCPYCLHTHYEVVYVGRKSEAMLREERLEEQRVSKLERQATSRRANSDWGVTCPAAAFQPNAEGEKGMPPASCPAFTSRGPADASAGSAAGPHGPSQRMLLLIVVNNPRLNIEFGQVEFLANEIIFPIHSRYFNIVAQNNQENEPQPPQNDEAAAESDADDSEGEEEAMDGMAQQQVAGLPLNHQGVTMEQIEEMLVEEAIRMSLLGGGGESSHGGGGGGGSGGSGGGGGGSSSNSQLQHSNLHDDELSSDGSI